MGLTRTSKPITCIEAPDTVPVSKFLNYFSHCLVLTRLYENCIKELWFWYHRVPQTVLSDVYSWNCRLKLENWKKEKGCVVSGGQGWEEHRGRPTRSVLTSRPQLRSWKRPPPPPAEGGGSAEGKQRSGEGKGQVRWRRKWSRDGGGRRRCTEMEKGQEKPCDPDVLTSESGWSVTAPEDAGKI